MFEVPEKIRELQFFELQDYTDASNVIPPAVLEAIRRFVVRATEPHELYIYWIGRQLKYHEEKLSR